MVFVHFFFQPSWSRKNLRCNWKTQKADLNRRGLFSQSFHGERHESFVILHQAQEVLSKKGEVHPDHRLKEVLGGGFKHVYFQPYLGT